MSVINLKCACVLQDRKKCPTCLIKPVLSNINIPYRPIHDYQTIGGALGCGVGRPWFLKKHVHEFVRGRGWGRVCDANPWWTSLGPAHNWVVLRYPPGSQTQSRSINGKGQPPCQRRERPYRGKADKTANEHLPPRVLIFCMTSHATSRVTFCHAKVKSWIKFLVC